MKTSIKLFNFVGAPVELSVWFFLIFLITPISWSVAIFFSVLIHEMAHAWVADRRGWKVHGIKIDLFTGSASIDTNIPERDSIPVVLAGPLSNLLLAIGTIVVGLIVVDTGINPTLYKFLNDFFVINLFMFIFNILPIYPMDGGRLVKDTLTLKMRSNRRLAKKIAGGISLVFSIGLLAYSISIFSIIMILFSALFIYFALTELEIIKLQK
jgi:stage IV sporulation protein FB